MPSRTSIIALSVIAVTVPILLVTFGLPAVSTNDVRSNNSPSIYNSTDYNFSIQYPNGWIVDESVDKLSPTSSILVSFSDPDYEAIIAIGKADDISYRSYGIITNVKDFAELTKVQLQQTYGRNIVLTNEGNLSTYNVDAYFIEYAPLDDSTRNKIVFLMNGDSAYFVMYDVDANKHDKHVTQLEQSISTFSFLSRWMTYSN